MILRTQRLVAAAVVGLTLGACQATGTDIAASTVDGLEKMQAEVIDGRDAISRTVAALDALAAEGGDMAAEYADYTAAVDRVEDARDRVREVRVSLARRRSAYSDSWRDGLVEIQDANLREKSAERHDAVIARFEELESQGDAVRADFDMWVTRVSDVRAYLEHDLNPTGVDAIEDQVEPIREGATDVRAQLEALDAELARLIAELRASRPRNTNGG